MRGTSRCAAAVCCLGLLAACGSSEPSSPAAPPVGSETSGSVTSTSSAGSTAAASTPEAATTGPARLLDGEPMEPCTVRSVQTPMTAAAVCGTLEVPEDRSSPSGRTIRLRVAVIRAQAETPEPDAFVALAGGPGGASTESFGWLPDVFAAVHATRDIVLVDQRGTGGSNPLVLPPTPDTADLDAGTARARLRAWAEAWLESTDADPRQYTSTVAADDLDAVRSALGYDVVDLYGPSYGSTLAQYYLRQHPDHVRVAVMDGGTPLDVPVFERMAANSQASLDLLFDRCAADPSCAAAFPDLPAEWSDLAGGLATGVATGVTDPATGASGVATLEGIGPAVHQALLDPASAGRLPLAIHLAHEGRWADAVEALGGGSGGGGGGDWLAMGEIIRCSEAWARYDPAEVERVAAGSYLLPAHLADATSRAGLCDVLPAGVVPADDAAPVVTDVPVLWLTGDGDAQDPPANLTAVPDQQPNARIVVVPAQQHTVGHVECGPAMIAEVVEAGTVDGVDTSCIEQAHVPGLRFVVR